MNDITISASELGRLLAAQNGGAALLYLYLRAGGGYVPDQAARELGMDRPALDRAAALLEQLGLALRPAPAPAPEKPDYTEQDVTAFLGRYDRFRLLVGEAQRRLGKVLSTESLKTLLGIYDFLGLPTDVIGILIGHCVRRAQARGNSNPPTLRAIEKEAARWSELGIDTVAAAADYVQRQEQRLTLLGQFRQALGLAGKLSAAEGDYLQSWADMGFDVSAVELAYERTRLATGTLKWNYMNKILSDWHSQGLHTAQAAKTEPRRGERAQTPERGGDQSEQEAVARLQRRRSQEG